MTRLNVPVHAFIRITPCFIEQFDETLSLAQFVSTTVVRRLFFRVASETVLGELRVGSVPPGKYQGARLRPCFWGSCGVTA